MPSSAGSSPASPQLRSHLLFCPVDKEENIAVSPWPTPSFRKREGAVADGTRGAGVVPWAPGYHPHAEALGGSSQ